MIGRTSASLLSLFLLACGGGGGGSTESGSASTGGSGSSGETPTTSGSTSTSGTESTSSTAAASSTSSGSSSGSSGASTGTSGGPDEGCAALPAGPFAPELLWEGYDGSEDLGFDGAGGLALKKQGALVVVTADQQETVLTGGLPQVYGTRALTGGGFVMALPGAGELQVVPAGGGPAMVVASGLEGPNGIYVDPVGDVWVTEFGGARVVRFAADWSSVPIFTGPVAESANGIVFDPDRAVVFFTNYGAGWLMRVPIEMGLPAGMPELVAEVPGAKLDGLALDACGHVYAVDQGKSQLYRIRLNSDANQVGEAELLSVFPENVANAQFGRGPGFDPERLYVAGNPGAVYTVAVGVPGAPIGLP